MADIRTLSKLARNDRRADTDDILAIRAQTEAFPEAVKAARKPSQRKPPVATEQKAYAMGRVARRAGQSKDANPFRVPVGERTSSNDQLMYRWDAGWDFEVC